MRKGHLETLLTGQHTDMSAACLRNRRPTRGYPVATWRSLCKGGGDATAREPCLETTNALIGSVPIALQDPSEGAQV
jgi:hypothetical protein